MNVFKLRSGGRLARLLAGLGALVTMLVVTGTAALAQVPPDVGGGGSQPAPALAPAAGGMPGWQITLIAVGAAAAAAVLAVLADRARAARRGPAVALAAGSAPAQASGAR